MKLDLSKSFDKSKAISYLEKLVEKKAKIEIKEFRPKRTNQQNRYFYACCAIFGDYCGYTVEEVKTLIKRNFGKFMVYEKNGAKFLRSTATLDKMEFMTFMDWFREMANNEGCYLLTPEEYYEQQFEIERQLNHMYE